MLGDVKISRERFFRAPALSILYLRCPTAVEITLEATCANAFQFSI